MKFKAEPVPFSSVVGQGIMLIDEWGAVIAQLSIIVPNPEHDYRQIADEVTKQITEALS